MPWGSSTPWPSLGVPALTSSDGPAACAQTAPPAMPSAQTLAATFDRRLAHAYGQAIAAELARQGLQRLARSGDGHRPHAARRPPAREPGRGPVPGRPHRGAEIRGVQGQHVIATLKHYIANNQEYGRTGFATLQRARPGGQRDRVRARAAGDLRGAVPDRRAAGRRGLGHVLLQPGQRQPTCENPTLLGRPQAGRRLQRVRGPRLRVRRARPGAGGRNAGVDSRRSRATSTGADRGEMFTSGQITAARLDDMVRRILFAMFDRGVFDDPVPATPAPGCARRSTRRWRRGSPSPGWCCSRTTISALPLGGRHLRSLAVIGPSGDDAVFVERRLRGRARHGRAGDHAAGGDHGARRRRRAHERRAGLGRRRAAAHAGAAAVLTPAVGHGHGLLGQLLEQRRARRRRRRSPRSIRPSTSRARPPAVGPVWSARWTGTLTPPETGPVPASLLEAGIAKLYRRTTVGHRPTARARSSSSARSTPARAAKVFAAPGPAGRGSAIDVLEQVAACSARDPASAGSRRRSPASRPPSRRPQAPDIAVVFANDAQGEGMDRTTLGAAGRPGRS